MGNHRNSEWCLIRSFTHFQLSQSAVSCHMLLRTQNGWFLKFLSKKVFDKNLCTRPLKVRFLVLGKSANLFNLWDLLFTYFQFSQIIWWLFLKIFYLLLPKIEICSDTFWTKNPQNQPLWAEKRTSLCCVMPTETRGHSDISSEFYPEQAAEVS